MIQTKRCLSVAQVEIAWINCVIAMVSRGVFGESGEKKHLGIISSACCRCGVGDKYLADGNPCDRLRVNYKHEDTQEIITKAAWIFTMNVV